jgi:hypothetical protein
MNKIIVLLTAATFISFVGCKEPREVTMEEVHQFEQGFPAIVPSARSMNTIVEERTDFRLIVGAPEFYAADKALQQEAAIKTGMLTLKIMGKDITKGTLIITKDVQDRSGNPADGIRIDMKIDSLKIAGGAQ